MFIRTSQLKLKASLFVAGSLLCFPLLPNVAHAQQTQSITMTRSVGGPGANSTMVSKRSLEKYCDILGLAADQRETALTMHSGYAAAYETCEKARREALDEVRRVSEDSGDQTVFIERLPKIDRAFNESTTQLEKEFFSDFKAILSELSQEDAWVKVERARRREVGLRMGALSGESVDLIDLVNTLKLDEASTKNLTIVLETYETELDRLLQTRLNKKNDENDWAPGKPLDMEKIQESMKVSREGGMKVREVNRENARKIQDLLPESKRPDFESAFEKASFPRVFRTPRIMKDIDASFKLSDLEPAQKTEIEEIKGGYERELVAANKRWAKAIEESESTGDSGGTLGGPGSRMTLMFGEEAQELKDARKTRRELDEKTNERLRKVLTESQREKLPKPSPDDEDAMAVPGRGMMIRRTE